jgi:hypothetical protein
MFTETLGYTHTVVEDDWCIQSVCKVGYQIPKILPEAKDPESLPAIPAREIIAVQHTKESQPGSQSVSPTFDLIVNRWRHLPSTDHSNPLSFQGYGHS